VSEAALLPSADAPSPAHPPSEAPSLALDAVGLSQRFGERLIYRDVTFRVSTGEVFVILGGSGSGKSTLMKQLIGLLPPSAGRVEVLGTDMYRKRGDVLRRIGVMFQSGALFGSMTLLDNVMLPLQMYSDIPPRGVADIARVKLGLVGLADAASLRPAEISGGMAKRAAIARALALDPPLLFLDEPSAGLDPITSAGLDRLILDLRRDLGTTFVVVTHELASIMAIADRCIMLDSVAQGVVAEGDPRALKADSRDPTVHAFFHREMLAGRSVA
jgi:phospholipid/cholesterol/gamma-HCH transport system ATP-binding protein